MDVRVLKIHMRQWCEWYNAHYSDDITILTMSQNQSWEDHAETMFWRIHTRVPNLVYKSKPTTQLWNVVTADSYALPMLEFGPDDGDWHNDPEP